MGRAETCDGEMPARPGALDPPKFRELIETQLTAIREQSQWDKDEKEKARVKKQLVEIAADWEGVAKNKKQVIVLEKRVAERDKQLEKAIGDLEALRKKKTRKNIKKGN